MGQIARVYARTPETKNENSASRIRKTGLSQPVKSPAKRILFLQRTIGNQAVQRLIKSGALQTKLTVNPPGDIYEQEADRVARQVVSRINQLVSHPARQGKPVQRQGLFRQEKCRQTKSSDIQLQAIPKEEEEEEEKLMKKDMVQRNEANAGWTAAPELENSIQQARGGGQPLSDNIRAPMEQAFGADFSGVRVHNDADSDMLNNSLQARAFTTGMDIFFKQGEYNPGTSAGQELIAHELTHVVQQNGDVGSKHKQAMQMRGEKLQRQPEEEEEEKLMKKQEVETNASGRALLGVQGQTMLIQRVATWINGPRIRNKDLAVNTINLDFSLGYTPPVLNGTEITTATGAKQAIARPSISGRQLPGNKVEVWFSQTPTNTASFNMYLPTAGPWSTLANRDIVAALIGHDGPQCQNNPGQTTFSVTGNPDHNALAQQVETHETHHAADHFAKVKSILFPWDAKITKMNNKGTKFKRADPEAAESALYAAAGGTPNEIAARLQKAWDDASDAFHKTNQGKTNIRGAGANGDCSTSYVTFTVP